VPRKSLPAMTRALSIPGRGEVITWDIKDSHCPLVDVTSSLPDEMRVSITSDFPIVPAIMTVLLVELTFNVGPVKLASGPTVYF